MTRYHAHGEPVWRDRADSLIQVQLSFKGTEYYEQLWARHVAADVFEVCCIPVFAYNLSLGDYVESSEYVVRQVVRRSGRYTFRVRFDLDNHAYAREEVMAEVQRRAHLFEWHSPALVALDADSPESAQALADLLAEREQRGELAYESGLERPPEELGNDSDF